MYEDFSARFQNFIDDMLDDIIGEMVESNLKYAGYRMYIKENSAKVKEILEKLSEEDREFMNEYESNYFNKVAIEQGEFYYRGYRDCIKLLKWLKVIWNVPHFWGIFYLWLDLSLDKSLDGHEDLKIRVAIQQMKGGWIFTFRHFYPLNFQINYGGFNIWTFLEH